MNKLTRIVFTCLLALFTFAVQAQEFFKLQGKILSADTKEPVPYAAIGFPEKGLGTVCDENGNFELKIPEEYKKLEVCVSALGFKQNCRPVSGFSGQNPTVLLEPANLQLATVEIKALSATELVKEAIRRIPDNYADKPVRYTFYQRQLEIKNERPAYIIESVNEAWRNHPKKDHQLTIKKSRGIATSKANRVSMNNTWVAVYTILIYTTFDNRPFLHPSKNKTYDYRLENEELIGNDTVYVIAFQPKKKKGGKEVAGDTGKLYLHKQSKAVIRIESASNQTELDEDNNSLDQKLLSKACKCVSNITARNNVTNFKQVGSRWYLSNAYNEGFHTRTGEAYAKPEHSHGITQLVVTDIQTENVQQIPEAQRVKRFRNHYSTAPKDMTEEFWQQYNVLPLPDAYKNAQEKKVGL